MKYNEALIELKRQVNLWEKGKEFAYYLPPLKVAIKALEKQIPKKPRVDDDGWLCCPNCNETFAMFDSLKRRLLCCGCCGQKLDWSKEDAYRKRSERK
jgi:hypothetical protein